LIFQASSSLFAFCSTVLEGLAWLNFFIKRDLRLAAVLGWITPFLAALSRALMAVATASLAGSGWLLEISCSARVTCVLVALLTDLFRSRFFSDTRAAFSADLLLGNPDSFLKN
jgi:hypothetical protein